ncbi:MAG: ribosome small subunit-dependent GTPase A [Planctomycetes bacterium]|nr:ribosome small subunit-dependent GTPase A [Planctomycetota bacterium]
MQDDTLPSRETMRAKGDLSRRRTIVVGAEQSQTLGSIPPEQANWYSGRVLNVSGILTIVERADGQTFACAVSRVLRTIAIEERTSVVAGDRVQFRLAEGAVSGPDIGEPQGMIERVEPRHGILTRAYRREEQVIAANVDQVLIVSALAEPRLKPNLIDRYIVAAEKGGIRSVLCLNKADLVDIVDYQPFIGLYSQLGYEVIVTSAVTGQGIRRLRAVVCDQATVVAGQSGVGKSSLLNAVEPALNLRIGAVSQSTWHGQHITRVAGMFKLSGGGWVVDTPGIRQFELWDVIPEELEGFFVEFRPYVSYCRFPSCTHTHESDCAIKSAVEVGQIDSGRYERYLNLFAGDRQTPDVCDEQP